MAANFNVVNLWSLTAPQGCSVTESSKERQVDLITARDEDANVIIAEPKQYGKMTASIKGTGILPIGALVAGTMAPGTLVVTSKRRGENQDNVMTFEIGAEGYYSRAA